MIYNIKCKKKSVFSINAVEAIQKKRIRFVALTTLLCFQK